MSTNLPLRQIADTVCVAPQLTPDAMAELARLQQVRQQLPALEHRCL